MDQSFTNESDKQPHTLHRVDIQVQPRHRNLLDTLCTYVGILAIALTATSCSRGLPTPTLAPALANATTAAEFAEEATKTAAAATKAATTPEPTREPIATPSWHIKLLNFLRESQTNYSLTRFDRLITYRITKGAVVIKSLDSPNGTASTEVLYMQEV